jgi:transcriptional regulator with XRE-family HTH domain
MANITNARQLGAEVREARRERGLSQEGLAAQAGVSRAWLTRFETGHPTASIEPLFRVLGALDLSLDLAQTYGHRGRGWYPGSTCSQVADLHGCTAADAR